MEKGTFIMLLGNLGNYGLKLLSEFTGLSIKEVESSKDIEDNVINKLIFVKDDSFIAFINIKNYGEVGFKYFKDKNIIIPHLPITHLDDYSELFDTDLTFFRITTTEDVYWLLDIYRSKILRYHFNVSEIQVKGNDEISDEIFVDNEILKILRFLDTKLPNHTWDTGIKKLEYTNEAGFPIYQVERRDKLGRIYLHAKVSITKVDKNFKYSITLYHHEREIKRKGELKQERETKYINETFIPSCWKTIVYKIPIVRNPNTTENSSITYYYQVRLKSFLTSFDTLFGK